MHWRMQPQHIVGGITALNAAFVLFFFTFSYGDTLHSRLQGSLALTGQVVMNCFAD